MVAQYLSAMHTIQASLYLGGTGVNGNICLFIIFFSLTPPNAPVHGRDLLSLIHFLQI